MPEDWRNEKTLRIAPEAEITVREAAAHGNALQAGTRLNEFEITGVIGEGGFGIVYAAYDHLLKRTVALKEYMPAALASRTAGLTVSVSTERYRDAFDAGLKSFVNEAQTLARFDHPCLVKVYRYWEANGTACMEMPLYEGITLKQTLKQMPQPPSQAWLIDLLADLLSALETIHQDNTFHRDISPDNILILPSGRPLLLDFGAARQVLGDMTHVLTVILKPGYAPIEQYADEPHLKQGAWTDLYALAAVAYFALTGKPPPPSVGRMMNDTLIPLAKTAEGRYSAQFLRAIDKALAVRPQDRPQNVAQFRRMLGILEKSPTAAPKLRPPARRNHQNLLFAVAGGLVLAALGTGLYYIVNPFREAQLPRMAQSPRIPQSPGMAQSPSIHIEEPVSPPREPFDPVRALNQIFAHRDLTRAVTVVPDKTKVRIGIDKFGFRLRSSKSGYVYIMAVGSDRASFNLLFPNAIDEHNHIDSGEEATFPRPSWRIVANGPPGITYFLAIVSAMPRDFTAAGLRKGDPYSEFPLDAAAQLAPADPSEPSPFTGKALCPQSGPCPNGYGAALFAIEEAK